LSFDWIYDDYDTFSRIGEIMMDLMAKLREFGDIHGIDYIGIAGIEPYHKEIAEIGGAVPEGYPRAISIGIVQPYSIVDRLGVNSTYEDLFTYEEHAYRVINERLDLFASIVASMIQRAGHRVMPIPAAERIDSDRVCASISHKITARLAGFGWIGKNCLLITPEHGPRVRWTTVLTDAPLEENLKVMDVLCGSCDTCVRSCPAQSFTGRNYADGEPREARFDVRKCEAYFKHRREETGLAVCGICLKVCPYGQAGQGTGSISAVF
jgi:epoxyqueuosine reductase QueG